MVGDDPSNTLIHFLYPQLTLIIMDTITNSVVSENVSSDERVPFASEAEEELDLEFFNDEKSRKPKGKKIKRMRTTFDR
jgi:hypothetical protein